MGKQANKTWKCIVIMMYDKQWNRAILTAPGPSVEGPPTNAIIRAPEPGTQAPNKLAATLKAVPVHLLAR